MSAGFSRQEYWSGLPFPSPIASSNQFLFFSVSSSFEPETQTETGSESELVTQSCPALCDPMDCSLPGSSLHGILQAGILEWVAFPFLGYLPDPGIKPGSPGLQADSLPSESPGKPKYRL